MAVNLNQELIKAARNGCLERVKYLLRQGADIHTTDRFGSDAAVRWASQGSGHLDVVRFLVKKGIDIRAADMEGPDCAVRWAASYGHLDIVHFLIENGSDIHACCDGYPDAAMHWAADEGHLDVIHFLSLRPGLVRCARAPPGVRPTREGKSP